MHFCLFLFFFLSLFKFSLLFLEINLKLVNLLKLYVHQGHSADQRNGLCLL